jgi:RNA-directed DNA polymerase
LFGFLRFGIRLNRNREGNAYFSKTPRMKKHKEIGRKVKAALKPNRDKPLKEVIQSANPVIRGWVNYFRIGNSNSTLSFGYQARGIQKHVVATNWLEEQKDSQQVLE